jgi:hypothetical protein
VVEFGRLSRVQLVDVGVTAVGVRWLLPEQDPRSNGCRAPSGASVLPAAHRVGPTGRMMGLNLAEQTSPDSRHEGDRLVDLRSVPRTGVEASR